MDIAENPVDLLTVIIALLAVIISVFSLLLEKRKAAIEYITVNRMDWIKEVRQLCADFLLEFNSDSANVDKLKELYIRIQLYGDEERYNDLFEALEACIAHANFTNCQKKTYADEALLRAQQALQNTWLRMKREAGISKRVDDKMEKARVC